jgi:quercetin dioxygenase-like cupin family protein
MDKELLKQQLSQEGFPFIYEWSDEAGAEYPKHAHIGKVFMFILEGGLTLWFDDGEITLKFGDQFDVPVGRNHTAKVGTEGCTYLVGEMIEGDS